jgi:hypothetical protein
MSRHSIFFRLIDTCKSDKDFRVRISLYISFGINVSYALFKLVSGLMYGAFWFDAFAVYYLLLTVIRYLLMRWSRNRQDLATEFRRYRRCGILLLILNIALSGVVVHMVVDHAGNAYGRIVIVTMVTYACYAVTMSVIDLIRYRKYERPVVSAVKAIRLTAALVSLLSVAASVWAENGKNGWLGRIKIAWAGTGVCLLVLGMSIYMILHANRALRKWQ